jgi:tRNA(Ser,Leu) C12 N-acetylase TAN1
MNSQTPEEVTENSLSVASALDSEISDLLKQESIKPVQTEHTKSEFDAERIRSAVARLASNSIDDLEKLSSELQQLQDFLKAETERVQHQIGDVLAGMGIIIETIAPWKTTGVAGTQNTHANGRDRLKRRP